MRHHHLPHATAAAGIALVAAMALVAEGMPHHHHPLHRQAYHLPPHPAVFAPAPPPTTLLHNSVTYSMRPDAVQADDALDVTQFHSQDSAGRVVFGFNTPDQSRVEARSLDGSVRGSYSYQDPTGKLVQVHYWDDGDGFHVAGNDMPYYTAEVEAARRHHMRLFQQALIQAQATATTATDDGNEYDEEVHEPEDEKHADDRDSVAVEVGEKDETEDDKEVGEEKPLSDYEDDDSLAVESAASFASIRVAPPAPGIFEPEANRKQVAQVTDLMVDSVGGLVLARTGPDGFQYLVPITGHPTTGGGPPLSESRHATLYGAVPVDAVHDAQVSPSQRMGVDGHQLKPLLLRTV